MMRKGEKEYQSDAKQTVEINPRPRELALQWLGLGGRLKDGGTTQSTRDDCESDLPARPARLGLGAKYVPHKKGSTKEEGLSGQTQDRIKKQILQKSLGKQREREMREEEMQRKEDEKGAKWSGGNKRKRQKGVIRM